MENEINFDSEGYFTNANSVLHNLLLVESKPPAIDNSQQVRLAIYNIENTLPHAINGLRQFYMLNPENRKFGYEYLINRISAIEKILTGTEVSYKVHRIRFLKIFSNEVENIFSSFATPRLIDKLKINAPKNVVYDLLKQLKICCVDGTTPFLSQTNEQLAAFLIKHIDGFENGNIQTIAKEISREQSIMKTRIEIKIKS